MNNTSNNTSINTLNDENDEEVSKIWTDPQEKININTQFDIAQFNKEFEKRTQEFKKEQYLKNIQKMDALKEIEVKKSLYKQSVLELAINTKDTWFDIMDDLLNQQFTIDTIAKNNRLFYIGLTIFIICIILYLYNQTKDQPVVVPENIQKIYHIYPSNNHIQSFPYPSAPSLE